MKFSITKKIASHFSKETEMKIETKKSKQLNGCSHVCAHHVTMLVVLNFLHYTLVFQCSFLCFNVPSWSWWNFQREDTLFLHSLCVLFFRLGMSWFYMSLSFLQLSLLITVNYTVLNEKGGPGGWRFLQLYSKLDLK